MTRQQEHECKQAKAIDSLFAKQRAIEIKVYTMWAVGVAIAGIIAWGGQTFYKNLREDMLCFRKDVVEIKIESAKTSTILERLEKKIDKEVRP